MSRPLTPAELAAEREAWKERERQRREERDARAPSEHPWRRLRGGSAKIEWGDEYVPPGHTGTPKRMY